MFPYVRLFFFQYFHIFAVFLISSSCIAYFTLEMDDNAKCVLLIAPGDRKFRISFRREGHKSDLESVQENFKSICEKDLFFKSILDCSKSHFIFKKYDDLFKCEVEITEADEIEQGSVLHVTVLSVSDPAPSQSSPDQSAQSLGQRSEEGAALNAPKSSEISEPIEPLQSSMPKKGFFIVKFLDSRERDVVPRDWLNKDLTMCSYPNYRSAIKLSEAVRNVKEVGQSWKVRPVEGIEEFETYEVASKNLHKFDQTDNGEPSAESEEAEKHSDEDEDELTMETVECDSFSKSVKQESLPSLEDGRDDISDVMDVFSVSERDNSAWITNSSRSSRDTITEDLQFDLGISAEELETCCQGCKQTFLRPLIEMKRKIQRNTDLINELFSLRGITPDSSFRGNSPILVNGTPPPQRLPLTSFEAIEAFNEYLHDSKNFSSSVAYFSMFCVHSTKHTVNKIMKELLDEVIAAAYNWAGRGFKKPFSEMTKICQMIFYAAKSNPWSRDATITEVCNLIKTWLRYTPSRKCLRPHRVRRPKQALGNLREVQLINRSQSQPHIKTVTIVQTSKNQSDVPKYSSNTVAPIKECNIRIQKLD